MAISASEARQRLFPLIQQVNDDAEAIEIVSRNGSAFLVPADEWRSIQETLYLMRSPANRARLLQSIAEAEAGGYVVTTLEELEAMVPQGEQTP
ncbi:MAG: type II toxin-antitoxin system Phd/YefM family antitoxin [Sporichthyaceae bacterium]